MTEPGAPPGPGGPPPDTGSRRARIWARVGLVILVVAAASGVMRASHGGSDFDGFHRAAAALVTSGGLPDDKAVERYPPSFVVLMAPLGWLPLPAASVLFALASLAALVRLPRALQRLSGIAPRDQLAAWFLAAPFLYDNLILLQTGPILIWLGVRGLTLARDARGIAGGALIGLAALIKVLPGALLAVPVVLGRGRGAVAGFLLALALAAGLVAAVLGPSAARQAAHRWREVVSAQSPWDLVESGRSLRYNNQALAAVFGRTFGVADPATARGAVVLARLDPALVRGAHAAVVGIALAAAGLALLSARRAGAAGWLAGLAAASVIMLVVSPLVWTHYFAWLLPLGLALAHRRRLLWIATVLAWAALASTPARALGAHMGLTLALLGVLAADLARGRWADAAGAAVPETRDRA